MQPIRSLAHAVNHLALSRLPELTLASTVCAAIQQESYSASSYGHADVVTVVSYFSCLDGWLTWRIDTLHLQPDDPLRWLSKTLKIRKEQLHVSVPPRQTVKRSSDCLPGEIDGEAIRSM